MPDKTLQGLLMPTNVDNITKQVAGVLQQVRAGLVHNTYPITQIGYARNSNQYGREIKIDEFTYREVYMDAEEDIFEIKITHQGQLLWVAYGKRIFAEDTHRATRAGAMDTIAQARASNTDPNSFVGPAAQEYYDMFYTSSQQGGLDNFSATAEVYLGSTLLCTETFFGKTVSSGINISKSVWEQQLDTLGDTLDNRRKEVNLLLESLTPQSTVVDALNFIEPFSATNISELVKQQFGISVSQYILDNLNYPWLQALSLMHRALELTVAQKLELEPGKSLILLDYKKSKREFEGIDSEYVTAQRASKITEDYNIAKDAYDALIRKQFNPATLPSVKHFLNMNIAMLLQKMPEDQREALKTEVELLVETIFLGLEQLEG